MTTDVFDESGLEVDDSDFAWDAFESDASGEAVADGTKLELNDPEADDSDFAWDAFEADVSGEAAVDGTNLELDEPEPDDSEFHWDRFAPDKDQPEAEGDRSPWSMSGARHETAFGRMEETVRLSDLPPPAPAARPTTATTATAPEPPAPTEAPESTTPPPPGSRPKAPTHARQRNRGLQFLTATAAAACILLAVLLAVALMRSAQQRPAPARGSPAASAPVTPRSPSDTTRILVATDEIDSATTAAQAGFATLPGFPTPTNVANVVIPYLSSLHLYETFMSETSAPSPAQAAAQQAVLEVRRDAGFLATIEGLPPAQLGTFLREYLADTAHLQVIFATLERDLQTKSAR